MITEDKEILGCFVSGPSVRFEDSEEYKIKAREKGKEFRSYIWGEKGIGNILKKLKHEDYGKDLKLVLFQFYLNPLPVELQNLKEIEAYRKREKSIGIPIIVNDENFFSRSDEERYTFLKRSIINKVNLLADVVMHKSLDTNVDLLETDLERILKDI